MSTHPVPWDASPHTKAKHALYDHYLRKWMPIMVRGFRGNITYAEGFSGPGVYIDGSPGSPVIALRSLVEDPHDSHQGPQQRSQVRVHRS